MNTKVEYSKKAMASRLAGLEDAAPEVVLERLHQFEGGLDAGIRELRRNPTKDRCESLIIQMDGLTTLLRRVSANLGT